MAPAMPPAMPPEDPPIGPLDLAGWAGEDFPATRRALEQAVERGHGRARVDALVAFARFALARVLEEEGRAALEAADGLDPSPVQRHELRLLTDAFRALGRTADAQASLFVRTPPGAAPDHHVWRSATLAPTRWAAAREGLPIALKRLLSYPPELRSRLLTLLADAAEAAADGPALNLIVLEMITVDAAAVADGRLDFFRGRLAELQAQPDTALAHYRKAAAVPGGVFGRRAELRAVELRRASGALDDAGVIAALEALRFAWRGDGVETDALAALGTAYARSGQTAAALDMFGLLGRRFGATAHGRTALAAGRALLVTVLDHLRPGGLDAMALHSAHGRLIALADDPEATLRRRMAGLLARDGFTLEAARLLHPLVDAARGARRAALGADLARILVDSGHEGEALDILTLTGEPGLDPAQAERRALLRAEALLATGDTLRALDALHGLDGEAALRLRADALFKAGEWAAARAAFGALVAKTGERPAADDVALHGLAAYMAGDTGTVRALADRHGARLAGTRWEGILDALAPAATAGPLSTGDIERHLAAADTLAGVARRWRAAP